jgi:large subunit ribosomal protein L29
MKISELRSMSTDDLQKKVVEITEEISNLSFQHKIRPLENTSTFKKLRKDIARINTIFNEN